MADSMGADKKNLVVKIELEYDISSGKFGMSGNVRDEVLTVGMLELALVKMKENYQYARIEELKAKAETAIIGVQ